MKARKSVCLFCWHSLQSNSTFQTTKRWISTRQREPYVLPRVVIDLDAADNAQVKQFEDLPPDAQERNLNGFEKPRYTRGRGTFKNNRYVKPRFPSYNKFDVDKNFATPTDLLSYALRGEGYHSLYAKQEKASLHQKFGIQPQDRVLQKVQEVTSSFIVNDAARLKKFKFTFDRKYIQILRNRIEDCDKLYRLRNLISVLSSTKEGCEFLAQNGDAINESLRLCRREYGNTPGVTLPVSRILRLLNNLHRNMESKGVQIGAALCNRGLYYAAKSGSVPAVKMYLQIFQQNSYEFDFYGNQTPNELLVSYFESSNSPSQIRKNDFLTVLTGYSSGFPTETETEPNVSIRTILDGKAIHKNMLYRKYLFTIAQLGLTSTLWSEWSGVAEGTRSNKYKAQRAHIFALAFCMAGDSPTAIEVLSSVLPHADIAKSESHRTSHDANSLRSMIYDHYRVRDLEASPEFWKRVGWEMQNIPGDAEEALEVLERWLVRDYESRITTGGRKRKVQLEIVEEKEVLMVWPLREGKPVYAKVLTQSPVEETVVEDVAESEQAALSQHNRV